MGTLFLRALLLGAVLPAAATEDTDMLGAGRWEINLGAAQELHAGSRERALPAIDVSHGLSDHLQLLLAQPFINASQGGESAKSGLGAATAGVKWRWLDAPEAGYALGWYPRFTWTPSGTSAARGVAPQGHSLLLPLLAGFRSGDTGLFAEMGRNLVQRGPDEWRAGVKVMRQCLPQLECRIELDHSRAAGTRGQTLLSAGGKWSLGADLLLQASAGRDIAGEREARRRLVLYLGVQLLR
jgi:hypothetical protein